MDASAPVSCRLLLLVEDDPPARRALTTLLRQRGWNVLAVDGVAKALASLDAGPRCIILDLMLPDGNGVSVLRQVRGGNLPIRVAVTTGTTDPVMLADVAALQPDALYAKPVDFRELERWLAAC